MYTLSIYIWGVKIFLIAFGKDRFSLDMTCRVISRVFWYPVKSDLFSVLCIVQKRSLHVSQGTRNTQLCLSGQVVYPDRKPGPRIEA